MARKNKISRYNGLFLINKKTGCTSHDVVNQIRRILDTSSVGHAGTLDPMASGLLVILAGEATKLSQFILEKDKVYRVKIQFGVSTTTYDREGEVIDKVSVDLHSDKIKQAVKELTGCFQWPVPQYSAVKIDGRKLYEYARAGQEIEIPLKEMNFYRVDLLDFGNDWCEVEMYCSKGSYVRSWAYQMGQLLGVGATVDKLERVASKPYSLMYAVTVDELQHQIDSGLEVNEQQFFIPISETLPEWATQRVEGRDEELLNHGQISRELRRQLIAQYGVENIGQGIKVVSGKTNRLIALITLEINREYVIRRVFL